MNSFGAEPADIFKIDKYYILYVSKVNKNNILNTAKYAKIMIFYCIGKVASIYIKTFLRTLQDVLVHASPKGPHQ